MKEPTLEQSFAVLCLQAGDEGRGPELFGDGVSNARYVVPPFLIGDKFPEVYLEFPLAGDPFMDVTLLYSDLPRGVYVDSPLARGTRDVLDFYATERRKNDSITLGFEIDCDKAGAGRVADAAVHFQPRGTRELVRPFFEAIGEPERAGLYLAQDARMPQGWKLSFLGLFRGRPHAPLRVCGYVGTGEQRACADDPSLLGEVLDRAGFTAYDDAMLAQAARVMQLAPDSVDFQLDVLPDGTLGTTFALDISFEHLTETAAHELFSDGAGARIVAQLREWGIADGRADHLANISFTRGIPAQRDDGTVSSYGFSLTPGWLKVRWRDGELQPSKMYLKAQAGFCKDSG